MTSLFHKRITSLQFHCAYHLNGILSFKINFLLQFDSICFSIQFSIQFRLTLFTAPLWLVKGCLISVSYIYIYLCTTGSFLLHHWLTSCTLLAHSEFGDMKDHITKLCQSCYYQLRQIRTVRHSLTSSAIQTLVHAFICTRVDFSNSLLYGTSAYLLDCLQSVLNSAARLILRIGKYDPISAAIRRDLHWLPIQFRVQYKLNSITSNCLAGRALEYLIELCHSVNDIPARRNLRLSSQVQLLVPWYRKERSGRRGFSVSSPQLWNLLMNINFSGRDLKLIICNSPCYATEDRCHQCELYYYYYYTPCTLLARSVMQWRLCRLKPALKIWVNIFFSK